MRKLSRHTLYRHRLRSSALYVFTGLLARMENEAQLAGVLAHEIIHVRNRHSYLSYRSYRKKMLTINLLSAVGAYSGLGGWGASLAAQFMLTISIVGYSRELEKEADLEGAQLMAASPYDPKAMVAAFESFSSTQRGSERAAERRRWRR